MLPPAEQSSVCSGTLQDGTNAGSYVRTRCNCLSGLGGLSDGIINVSHDNAFGLACTWEIFASSVKIEFLESSQTATIDIFACGKNGEDVMTYEENNNVMHYCDWKTDRIVVPAGAKQTHTLQGYMFVSIEDTNPIECGCLVEYCSYKYPMRELSCWQILSQC